MSKTVYVINNFLSNFEYEVGKFYSYRGIIFHGNYDSLMEYYNSIDDILDRYNHDYGSDFLKEQDFKIFEGKISDFEFIKRFDNYFCTSIEIIKEIKFSEINQISEKYEFDNNFNLLSNGRTKFEYYDNELIVNYSDGTIKKYEIKMDEKGRLLFFRDNKDNAEVQYEYENDLLIKEVKNGYGSLTLHTYKYDKNSRLIEESVIVNNKKPEIFKYKYDKYGNKVRDNEKFKYRNDRLIEKRYICDDGTVVLHKYTDNSVEKYVNNEKFYTINIQEVVW